MINMTEELIQSCKDNGISISVWEKILSKYNNNEISYCSNNDNKNDSFFYTINRENLERNYKIPNSVG